MDASFSEPLFSDKEGYKFDFCKQASLALTYVSKDVLHIKIFLVSCE